MYKNTCMHKKISHLCLGWFTEKYILRQFLSIYYISLNLSTCPSFKRTWFSCTRLCLWVHWYDRWYFFNIVIKTDSSYFEIKIQNQKSLCPAIGLTTALLSTGMFYACGWGDEDGKPTYGYHGEDGCIKKNMFDGTLCLFLNLFFSFNHSIFFKKLLIKFKKEKYMHHFLQYFTTVR